MASASFATEPQLAAGFGWRRRAGRVPGRRAAGDCRAISALSRPLLTGVSAGAINVAHLANHVGAWSHKIEDLMGLWRRLGFDDVFRVDALAVIWRVTRIGMRLSVGLPPGVARAHSMVDTRPLREFLQRNLGSGDGPLPGIARNIAAGDLSAVALTALNYDTGETITFVEGKAIENWERPLRKGLKISMTVEHIMASAALPLLFSPVAIGNEWYGDGGIRLVAPLSPAVHLGADRMLVISTHYEMPPFCRLRKKGMGPPSPAVVLGAFTTRSSSTSSTRTRSRSSGSTGS